ncbi:uncharacterized protein CMU_030440 [Cryptosporidium muris RN66]|uniref:Uncharacterized protein n=1 Tax=Cryptosporidium muris (strain RN66) TaxID=441375 RepID=B6AK14_CRYMR|nr:uncharacterized protein CMU_030440 [Cryptosporidium muris RN66]EEA08555.1 hypothetical protein CMU_030440 [Cryptosporidium muris RN66]|eukprot:XP_002142904.1 hypothetical protein [Cryptosporidium muris RN66]
MLDNYFLILWKYINIGVLVILSHKSIINYVGISFICNGETSVSDTLQLEYNTDSYSSITSPTLSSIEYDKSDTSSNYMDDNLNNLNVLVNRLDIPIYKKTNPNTFKSNKYISFNTIEEHSDDDVDITNVFNNLMKENLIKEDQFKYVDNIKNYNIRTPKYQLAHGASYKKEYDKYLRKDKFIVLMITLKPFFTDNYNTVVNPNITLKVDSNIKVNLLIKKIEDLFKRFFSNYRIIEIIHIRSHLILSDIPPYIKINSIGIKTGDNILIMYKNISEDLSLNENILLEENISIDEDNLGNELPLTPIIELESDNINNDITQSLEYPRLDEDKNEVINEQELILDNNTISNSEIYIQNYTTNNNLQAQCFYILYIESIDSLKSFNKSNLHNKEIIRFQEDNNCTLKGLLQILKAVIEKINTNFDVLELRHLKTKQDLLIHKDLSIILSDIGVQKGDEISAIILDKGTLIPTSRLEKINQINIKDNQLKKSEKLVNKKNKIFSLIVYIRNPKFNRNYSRGLFNNTTDLNLKFYKHLKLYLSNHITVKNLIKKVIMYLKFPIQVHSLLICGDSFVDTSIDIPISLLPTSICNLNIEEIRSK